MSAVSYRVEVSHREIESFCRPVCVTKSNVLRVISSGASSAAPKLAMADDLRRLRVQLYAECSSDLQHRGKTRISFSA